MIVLSVCALIMLIRSLLSYNSWKRKPRGKARILELIQKTDNYAGELRNRVVFTSYDYGVELEVDGTVMSHYRYTERVKAGGSSMLYAGYTFDIYFDPKNKLYKKADDLKMDLKKWSIISGICLTIAALCLSTLLLILK